MCHHFRINSQSKEIFLEVRQDWNQEINVSLFFSNMTAKDTCLLGVGGQDDIP